MMQRSSDVELTDIKITDIKITDTNYKSCIHFKQHIYIFIREKLNTKIES